MTRRLLNLLTVLSVLLGVAVVVLWVMSYWPPVEWTYVGSPQNRLLEVRGVDGEYCLGWANHFIALPCFLPFLLLIVWPCVALALTWKRRHGRRGFPLNP